MIQRYCLTEMWHTNKEVLTGKDNDERIQVIGIGPCEPWKVNNGITAVGLGQDFEVRLGTIITTDLSTHDKDRAIGKDGGGGIPATPLFNLSANL